LKNFLKKYGRTGCERVADQMTQNLYMSINLVQYRENISIVRKNCGNNIRIIPVLKANAYGHGIIEIARASVRCGCNLLAVSRVDEAILLRNSGIDCDIMVLYQVFEKNFDEFAHYNLIPAITSIYMLDKAIEFAVVNNVRMKVHIVIDTGMGNIGVTEQEYINCQDKLWGNPCLNVGGVLTHFISAYNSDELGFCMQKSIFDRCIGMIPPKNRAGVIVHAASSPSFLKYNKDVLYDAIRLATLLYGMPVPHCSLLPGIKPILEIKSVVADTRSIRNGDSITGYDSSLNLSKDTLIAVVPIGYGDYWWLNYARNLNVLVGGKRAHVVGTRYMDRMLVDITNIDNIYVGDEVVLIGRQQDEIITIEEICEKSGIRIASAETVAFAFQRVPRVYIDEINAET
jgi:alanine racemase